MSHKFWIIWQNARITVLIHYWQKLDNFRELVAFYKIKYSKYQSRNCKNISTKFHSAHNEDNKIRVVPHVFEWYNDTVSFRSEMSDGSFCWNVWNEIETDVAFPVVPINIYWNRVKFINQIKCVILDRYKECSINPDLNWQAWTSHLQRVMTSYTRTENDIIVQI